MSTFVHDFYMSNMETMRANYERAMEFYKKQKQINLPQPVEEEEPEISEAERKKEEAKAKEEKEKEQQQEADIMFESMDFEKLEEVPKL
ncbi:unnamed protein product [Strongylus vulgaris]|nr:unnamed protein product [Strongylus vulgaris]